MPSVRTRGSGTVGTTEEAQCRDGGGGAECGGSQLPAEATQGGRGWRGSGAGGDGWDEEHCGGARRVVVKVGRRRGGGGGGGISLSRGRGLALPWRAGAVGERGIAGQAESRDGEKGRRRGAGEERGGGGGGEPRSKGGREAAAGGAGSRGEERRGLGLGVAGGAE